jgi:hypothetical protein
MGVFPHQVSDPVLWVLFQLSPESPPTVSPMERSMSVLPKSEP